MTILLVRHGETPLNVVRVLQPADTRLSSRGVQQAQALARRLADMHIAAIVTSDLPRARQTGEFIAAATGAPVEITGLLRERDFGDWRGRSYDTLPANPLLMVDAPPGGESAADFAARVAQAFALIVQRAAAAPAAIAVVTHGLVVRAMLAAHIRLPASTVPPVHLGNTSLSVIDGRSPYTASLVNCTRHLDLMIGDDLNALSGG